ncbi:hypothetical protein SAZ11_61035 [Streptomyces sp. FXJ1.4098]|nr:hypothetical protein [Streptomyces sp. FXJ1.4098]
MSRAHGGELQRLLRAARPDLHIVAAARSDLGGQRGVQLDTVGGHVVGGDSGGVDHLLVVAAEELDLLSDAGEPDQMAEFQAGRALGGVTGDRAHQAVAQHPEAGVACLLATRLTYSR